MTDYLYSLSLAQQTKCFLLSLGFGFIMGIFYDLFRIVRISLSRGKAAIIVFDIVYCVFLCLCTFVFCLAVNEGEIRGYMMIGEAVGFLVYYFSLGVFVFSATERIIGFIKGFFVSVFKIISFPFRWIGGKLCKFIDKILKKSRKKAQKMKNKSKFLLKVNKHLLYNLNVKKQNSAENSGE